MCCRFYCRNQQRCRYNALAHIVQIWQCRGRGHICVFAMPPRRKRSPAPARSSKRRVLRRRPSKLVLDVDQTTEFVRFLLEDAQQGNGRELAYYHAISETLTHFSRCTRQGDTRISMAPQHAFCNDTYPDIIVNRGERAELQSDSDLLIIYSV